MKFFILHPFPLKGGFNLVRSGLWGVESQQHSPELHQAELECYFE
jgi:hypothetical protein